MSTQLPLFGRLVSLVVALALVAAVAAPIVIAAAQVAA